MKIDPNKHHRRSIRLAGYDYALPGAYFVTIDTWHMQELLGEVVSDVMRVNPLGRIVEQTWEALPNHYPHVVLDAFCVMPNHVHGILIIKDMRRGGSDGQVSQSVSTTSGKLPLPATTLTRPPSLAPKRHALPEIVRAFKSYSAQKINRVRGSPGVPVWQRNYYEHILRDQLEWKTIRKYIHDNPSEWGKERG